MAMATRVAGGKEGSGDREGNGNSNKVAGNEEGDGEGAKGNG
jgi:hypothetical protein